MQERQYASPYGVIRLGGQDGRLCRVLLGGPDWPAAPPDGKPLGRYAEMLDRYFSGRGILCEPELLCTSGLSDFQSRVYRALATLGFGRLVSYGALARLAGCPRAARAVGRALAANPLAIFVPCHRVVTAGGRPGGFSAGQGWKRSLLRHEGWTVRAGRLERSKEA
ncbi:unnamed protein product [marine sediment metagenome]|uniref:methylated-DNA--[protein]-cysteine S-methyltransferase n=1 Tax=marine sediment metagenome TaxID=412755 RepID=X0S8P7_9ZZZZ